MLQRSALRSVLPALALVLLAATGCDLLLAPPPVIGGGGGRRPQDDECEEGEGEEGEGEEGEGEPDVPPDIRPDPAGPNIQSISLSSNRLNSDQSAELTVVVTDVDGAGDIIGPLLIEPVSGTTLGTLSSPAAGTFTATISWDTWSNVDPIAFVSGGGVRFIRVQFSDNAGHQVTATQRVELFCDGNLPACDNTCGFVECDGECAGVEEPPSAAQLCAGCNTGCANNAGANAVCFNPDPSCGGGADCVLAVNDNQQVESSTCRVVGAITLREDNIAVWRVGGVDVPLFISQRNNADPLGEVLCEDHGGFNFVNNTQTLPPGLNSSERVIALEDPACTSNVASCEPVSGRVSEFGDSVDLYICNQPVNPDVGTFGHACFNGGCSDGSFCSGNVCAESCSSAPDCDLCTASEGSACVCNGGTGVCEGNDPDEGGFGEPCRGGTGCDDTSNLFCDSSNTGTCLEFCSFSSDCEICSSESGNACTCNTDTGICEGGGGGGGGDFSCVTSGSRNVTNTGSFSGSNSGSSLFSSPTCGGAGAEQFWKFTPPTTRSYTIGMSGFDTVLTVLDGCGGAELTCNDDNAVTGGRDSLVTVSLTAGVPVVIVADSFGSSAGSYTLTID